MWTTLEQREIFHLVFLRQMASRFKPNSYALKGGVNLRFFFGSVRYSEDMDLDIKRVETHLIKEMVMEILSSKTLILSLRPFQIDSVIPPDMKVAKQTDTTQRFKVHLVTSTGEDLFTKVEFSKRKFESSVSTEAISGLIVKHYKLSPLLIPHYLLDAAIIQKVRAIADRTVTQARDLFDLYILLSQNKEDLQLPSFLPKTTLVKANKNIFEPNYEIFKDTVLSYLDKESQKMYHRKEVWDDIQLNIANFIEEAIKNG